MLQLLHPLVRGLIHLIQPILVPLCFGLAWLLVALVFWSLWSAMRDAVSHAKQMHEIPCADCQFFTNSHYLKCPVHPNTALSTEAINCPDYQAASYSTLPDDEVAR
ncbi:hypothetical protein HJG54_25995 [Leptolyngbya sp. NK1-12]|uniref:Uncharacterized protein n=1 Tax=Leptolyngbya sp. NK1-12 TaxID=2547451 RepID=A0AA97ARV2_9CYAN|nr:hypothetical protein [Leptolyngbya sp. NK1-12]WNZ25938.1 hypothetical protein HJG54_25995 [Leptolyngbya sp. NK1-12]